MLKILTNPSPSIYFKFPLSQQIFEQYPRYVSSKIEAIHE